MTKRRKRKICCENCKWHDAYYWICGDIENRCIHPNNMGDSFCSHDKMFLQEPSEINKDNDCEDYESGESGMSYLSKSLRVFCKERGW